MNLKILFRDAIPNVAGVTVFESDDVQSNLGRWSVFKIMNIAGGATRHTAKYYKRKQPAIAYAKLFLSERAEKVGQTYIEGAGKAVPHGYTPFIPATNKTT